MSEDKGGAVILGVVVLALVGIACRTGIGLGSIPTAGTVLGWAVALGLVAGGLVLLGRGAGRHAIGHSHGSRRTVADHESGHMAAARRYNAPVKIATVGGGRGRVEVADLPDAKAEIVFLRAGRYAAGTGRGCAHDDAAARRALREYPRGDRARVWAEANREARRIVRRDRARIQRDAERLLRESSRR